MPKHTSGRPTAARRSRRLIAVGSAVALTAAGLTAAATAASTSARPAAGSAGVSRSAAAVTQAVGTYADRAAPATALAAKALTSAVIPGLSKLENLGPVPATQRMTVGVSIPGDTAALEAAARAVMTKGSATFGQTMTPEQVRAAYGVSPAVSAAVQRELESDGLVPVYVSTDGSYVELSGSAAEVEKTFGLVEDDYLVGGKTYFANATAATVPSAVGAVVGLTSFADFHIDGDTLAAVARNRVTTATGSTTSSSAAAANASQAAAIAAHVEYHRIKGAASTASSTSPTSTSPTATGSSTSSSAPSSSSSAPSSSSSAPSSSSSAPSSSSSAPSSSSSAPSSSSSAPTSSSSTAPVTSTPTVSPTSSAPASGVGSQNTCVEVECTGVVSAPALWGAYNMPNSGLTGDLGQGQKIAIFGEGDLSQVVKDLRLFEQDTYVDGDPTVVKPTLPAVPVGETLVNDPQGPSADTSGLGEWDLDSQSSTGISPDLAQLQFYFGADLTDASIAGIYSAWVNDDNGAMIGNSSFGGCEPLEAVTGDETTDDALFAQAVMEGRTMFASTGDTGSGGCVVGVDVNGLGNGGAPAVEYPSASPYVIAVGGTVLYTAAAASAQTQPPTRSLEYAWTYTGGGYSDFEAQPADQAALEKGTALPEPQPCVMPTGSLCRSVPDVAAMSGDVITNGYGIESAGAQTETGGTSLSSPLWAGMWARVRAAHATTCATGSSGSGQLTFAQPLLYSLAEGSDAGANSFFDVGGTSDSEPSGNGTYTPIPRTPIADPSGFDLVSGLGTPNLTGITKALDCGSTAPTTTTVPNQNVVVVYPPAAGSCPANGTYPDRTGDESPTDSAIDLTGTRETATSTGIQINIDLAALPESNPAFDDLYDYDFSYLGSQYEVEADNGNPTGAFTYTLYSVSASTSTSLGTLPGTVDDTTGVISIQLPFATFNGDAKPATPLGIGTVLTGISLDTETLLYEPVNYSDTIAFGACTYTVEASS